MEIFFKIMNLYPHLADFDENSILEPHQSTERSRGPREQKSEALTDESTDRSDLSEISLELYDSSDDESEILADELFKQKVKQAQNLRMHNLHTTELVLQKD